MRKKHKYALVLLGILLLGVAKPFDEDIPTIESIAEIPVESFYT